MGRRRRNGRKPVTQPSDHDPKVREGDIALAAMIGVTYQVASYTSYSRVTQKIYGWISDPFRSGYRVNSPMYQQQYQVARWFVERLKLRETLPNEVTFDA